jgi:hypothetical protein
MNIDQQLRAALSQEAEMQNAPAPDMDKLISGGRVRQRRRNLARAGVGVAVAVVVAGGVYGVARSNIGTTDHPAGPVTTTTPSTATPTTSTTSATPPAYNGGDAAEPGRYRMLVGENATASKYADVTFHEPWEGDNYPWLHDHGHKFGGLAVYQPLALSAGSGCLSDNANPHVGHTPQQVAQQLAQLPHSTVLQPPTPVQAFGRHAVYLRTRINNRCGNDIYRVAMTINGGHGISYGHTPETYMDFWVQDVGGVPVVVETWHQQGASSQMVDQISSSRRSITFATGP